MPPKVDQATLLILDIGRNVSDAEEKNEKSFFEAMRECAARIIERKIISQGKNLLGVLLLGSKKTKNNMAEQCQGAFRRIELFYEMQHPYWEMIRNLPDKTTTSQGDWLEAIVVAADHFKNGVSGANITNKKIVLMTNFKVPTSLGKTDFDQILEGLKEDNFELDVIGPDIYDGNCKGDEYELAKQLIEETNGATAPFEDTMRYLQFHRKKITKPTPSNVDLSIGPNIKIPVSIYIRLKDEPVVKNWGKAIKDPVTNQGSTSEAIVKEKIHVNTENQTVVETTEVIKGYNYGQQIIPFSESDKSMLYDSGEKSFSLYGVTESKNITWQNLTGDCLYYIFGKKGNKKAQTAIRCLVECLHEQNLVGIARKVYQKGNAPKMYVIMPVIDGNNYICLSMTAICFKDEIKYMAFPDTRLKKYDYTEDQVNAFKDLIKAMDLTKAYDEQFDDSEAFPIAETVSPSAQYILDCIAYRAMNPEKPLPQPRDEIMQLFKQPPAIENRAREPLSRIKEKFTLNEIEVKPRKPRKTDAEFDNPAIKPDDAAPSSSNQTTNDHDIPKIHLPKISNDVEFIGTVDPVTDFKTLVGKGKSLADLSSEMSEAIENLIYCNLDGNYSKALSTMKFFREKCVKGDPTHYNAWLQKFKKALIERKKDDLLGTINENGVNYILKEENSLSSYDENTNEDSQFYENDTIPNSTDLVIGSDVMGMFDGI